jgi:copper chaperone
MCTACSCTTNAVTTGASADAASPEQPGHTSEFKVTGMTCGHCVSSVTEEIEQIDGVGEVSVDLGTGAVTVTADQPVPAAAVTAAIRRAGYQIA